MKGNKYALVCSLCETSRYCSNIRITYRVFECKTQHRWHYSKMNVRALHLQLHQNFKHGTIIKNKMKEMGIGQ